MGASPSARAPRWCGRSRGSASREKKSLVAKECDTERITAYEGGTSAEAFLRFAREARAPSLHPGDVVVMDNLGAHRAVAIREAIEAAGVRVLYLPPYHPELNPIELAWSS